MVKYLARNIAMLFFFITLFVLIGMPSEYNMLGGIILAIYLIAYGYIGLTLDKEGL